MYKIRLANGKAFEAAGSDSIVKEALAAGVVLEYSCNNGRCCACRASVNDGSTVLLTPELGLTKEDRAAGDILLCCRRADSDLLLSVSDLGGRIPPPRRLMPARIHALRRYGADILKVVLRLPPTSTFDFLPGQYVNVSCRGHASRSYSLASSPRPDAMIELLIRYVPDGVMSQYWFHRARENDLLQIDGPLGSFYMRDAQAKTIIFMATGTGIAPVKSMLEELAAVPAEERSRELYLFWGGRTSEDLFLDLDQIDLDFVYTPVLSRPEPTWHGMRGHVQDAVIGKSIDLSGSVVYACGSPAMIASSRERLSAEGLDPNSFHFDAFVASSL